MGSEGVGTCQLFLICRFYIKETAILLNSQSFYVMKLFNLMGKEFCPQFHSNLQGLFMSKAGGFSSKY